MERVIEIRTYQRLVGIGARDRGQCECIRSCSIVPCETISYAADELFGSSTLQQMGCSRWQLGIVLGICHGFEGRSHVEGDCQITAKVEGEKLCQRAPSWLRTRCYISSPQANLAIATRPYKVDTDMRYGCSATREYQIGQSV